MMATHLEAESDATLASAVAAGDAAAIERLVLRYEAPMFRFARSITKSDALAEEVTQEAFLRALGAAGSFRGEGSLKSWLLTIARNLALRHRPREVPLGDEEALESLGVRAGWGSPPDPEAQVSAAERSALLWRALDALGDEDREVLVLRELEGLTGPETQEVLGTSLAAVKSRLHRARLRLVAALREDQEEK